ncbi:MAG TPA: HD domain-containing protein [Methanocorpusculum sp.]|nr:HD domain-containing protein [Methanocorpusculum sp.]
MEKTVYVKDITNGTAVDAPFAIKRADLRAKRGEQYLHITVADRTGVLEAKFYGEKAAEAARSIKTGQVYRIIGTGKVPQGGSLLIESENEESLDAILDGTLPLSAGEDMLYIYTPAKIEENASELQKIVASIQNQNLRIFVACCLDSRFYECPAAIRRHHEYIGGLCEHSLETVKIALSIMDTMPRTKINRDMVIAGCVLHDIGKIFCFDKVGQNYVPNDTYNLIEHITMGIMFIDEYKSLLTDSQLLQIRHIIQSHHGIYGDVVQLTAEAWLVNEADGASSRLRSIVDDLEAIPAGQKKKGLHSEKFLWKAI